MLARRGERPRAGRRAGVIVLAALAALAVFALLGVVAAQLRTAEAVEDHTFDDGDDGDGPSPAVAQADGAAADFFAGVGSAAEADKAIARARQELEEGEEQQQERLQQHQEQQRLEQEQKQEQGTPKEGNDAGAVAEAVEPPPALNLRHDGHTSAPSAKTNEHRIASFKPHHASFRTAVSSEPVGGGGRSGGRKAMPGGTSSNASMGLPDEEFWPARMSDMRHLCHWPSAEQVPLAPDDFLVRPQRWWRAEGNREAVVPSLEPDVPSTHTYTSRMYWNGRAHHDDWARGKLPFPFHDRATNLPLEKELSYFAGRLSPDPLRRFGTCAIVGSGGALKGAGLGEEIDRHGAVIRFNENKVEGYERDVGRRTTYRLVYPESFYRPIGQNDGRGGRDGDVRPTQLLFMPYKRQDYTYLWKLARGQDACASVRGGFWKKPPLCKTDSINVTAELRLFSPEFLVMAEECYYAVKHGSVKTTGKRPSSGFFGMLFALSTSCRRLHLYGFGVTASKYCKYTDPSPGRCDAHYHSQHDYDLEMAWYHQLAQSGFVRFMT